jgi:hypothetical protein
MIQRGICLSVLLGGLLITWLAGCATTPDPEFAQRHVQATAQTSASNIASPDEQRQHAVDSLARQAGGPACGWLIATTRDNIDRHQVELAEKANRLAEQQPATPGDVQKSDTADLNHDGFVTLDEILAMKRAGLNDGQILDRIRRTDQVFNLTDHQKQYLRDRGISNQIVDAMGQRNSL